MLAKTAEFFEPFFSIYPQVCYVIKKGDFKERGCSRMDKLEKGACHIAHMAVVINFVTMHCLQP